MGHAQRSKQAEAIVRLNYEQLSATSESEEVREIADKLPLLISAFPFKLTVRVGELFSAREKIPFASEPLIVKDPANTTL